MYGLRIVAEIQLILLPEQGLTPCFARQVDPNSYNTINQSKSRFQKFGCLMTCSSCILIAHFLNETISGVVIDTIKEIMVFP